MALHIHRAERTDVLADGLGALLVTPPPDPFARELVTSAFGTRLVTATYSRLDGKHLLAASAPAIAEIWSGG